ncbi:uncharacterized protein LOC142242847 [Haematobia irritans]|uniref:uncharacterized protein LOC142242847 n=1 Tax=Haematobia irritans TaxID=7368 RepID=UPI003F4F6F7A
MSNSSQDEEWQIASKDVNIENAGAAAQSPEAERPLQGLHAESIPQRDDKIEGQSTVQSSETKRTASTPKSSAKVRHTSFRIIPSTTRSGLIRREPVLKRARSTIKNKDKGMSKEQLPKSVPANAVVSLSSATSTTNSNMGILTSQTSGLSINDNNNAQIPIAATSSSILPANTLANNIFSGNQNNELIASTYNPQIMAAVRSTNVASGISSVNNTFAVNHSGSNIFHTPFNNTSLPSVSISSIHPASSSNSIFTSSHIFPNSAINQHLSSSLNPNSSFPSQFQFQPNQRPIIYNGFSPSLSHYPTLNTAPDISLSTSHIAARQAISKDLPIFSGKPEDWPIFITNYIQSTERCGFTEQENLIRLQKCLKGAALEAVRGKLMMPTTVNLAIETLRMLYGRPEVIHQSLQRNLRNEPVVRKERLDTLIHFALAVQNYRTTLQAMGLDDYLNDPMLLQEMVEKLPADFKLDWGKYRITLSKVDIVSFDTWLFNLASCATQVTSAVPGVLETKASKKEQRLLMHDVVNEPQSKNTISCFKCACSHMLYDCPEFKELSVSERWNFVRSNNLCIRCFKKHHIKRCKSKRQCGVDSCKMSHNSLLHKNNITNSSNNNNLQQQTENHSVLFHSRDEVLFKYMPVTLSSNRHSLNTYALIDEGASCSLIEKELADQLGLDGPSNELCLRWTGKITQKEEESKTVSLHISDREHKTKLIMNDVRTVKNLDLPVQTLTKKQIDECEHLRNLPILPYNSAKARIIIGVDNAKLCVPLEIKESATSGLIAVKSRIGWGVYGKHKKGNLASNRIFHICSCNTENKMWDELLKNYFSLDSVGVVQNQNKMRSVEDERAKIIMENTTKYDEIEKRWETGLLWKYDKINLPNSFPMAKRRLLCLENKMNRDAKLKAFLIEKFKEYENKGYVRKLEPGEIKTNNSWYIPVFTVYNKHKDKTRIVWDAAASVDNISLNSLLLKGPDQLRSLVGILIRFRERPIAISGDIREMFHQIRIRQEDLRYQQFLWRSGDSSKPISVYAMTVMTFGASCSPSLANYIKNRNALRFMTDYPKAVKSILNNTFVDDWLQSVDMEDEMIDLARTVHSIHDSGGFEMRNWHTNSNRVLHSLDTKEQTQGKKFEGPNSDMEKVLGMWWDTEKDEFGFFENYSDTIKDQNFKPTKRNVLRVIMTIFDPLGLLAHFVIHGKILMQDIWRSGVGWDEPIESAECEKWWKWINILPKISTVRIPRCYPLAYKSGNIQLHVFVDASIDAYAAVAYIRSEYSKEYNCSIICSKTRVAPLKPISVPKMELMAALIGLRLAKFCCSEFSLKISRRVFWSDSKDVLYWIRSDARKFQQFVAVRIGEILEDSNVSEWKWVPSAQNVADDATKWKGPPDFNKESRWFRGPSFLRLSEDSWPQSEFSFSKNEDDTLYHISLRKTCPTFIDITVDSNRFSTWERMHRSQKVVFEFLNKISRGKIDNGDLRKYLETPLYEAAELILIRTCQEEVYFNEIQELKHNSSLSNKSDLYKCSPYLDQFGLLRIKGRIDAAKDVPICAKRPLILPQKHRITQLLIDFYHRKYHHHHNEIIVNELRQKYFILGMRAAVRCVAKNCKFCQIRRSVPQAPTMGDLPLERLASFSRPFHYTGVDYFGPLNVIIGKRNEKRWGVLFTCMTVRATHIEIAPSLSTDSFLLVLKQFICRRGTPHKIVSDNATNFRGASRVLSAEIEKISSDELERKYPTIEWSFIPPATPHMGGAWERMIRSTKSVLMDIISERNLREEQLRAALADVENILNSRPLTYVPLDSPNGEALTPNHFLLGSSSGIRERANPDCSGTQLSKNFRISNMIANEFWKRWVREYLPCLTRRTKWYGSPPPIEIGDVVIIVDSNAKRNEWLKGVVIDVHRGRDDIVRSAVIKTKGGLLTRPIVKLAKLDVN